MPDDNSRRLYSSPTPSRKGGEDSERILVIRLGALGDLVLCFQAFHEIRCAHSGAEIALLTMPAFADFAQLMPWLDQILIDERPSGWALGKWRHLAKQVRNFKPTRVYDLQGKSRQTILYGLLGGPYGPEWSGAAPHCSHPRLWPPKPEMHFTDFVGAQLRLAHIPPQPPPNLAWLDAPLNGFTLPRRYVLLIPGCAPDREYKRWPARFYATLAQSLRKKGIDSIAIGTKQDTEAVSAVMAGAPHILDFSGHTTLPQLAALARRSVAVIGNDTGPAHLAAAVGAPVLTLMSDQVDPLWSAPRGPNARWLQGKPLEALGVNQVSLALRGLIDRNE